MGRKRVVGRIERRRGYLYYVDSEGRIWEAPLRRGGGRGKKKGKGKGKG